MPHGHCYQWDPSILWTSVISDGLIAAAYIAIPFTLVFQIMRKRKDLPFDWMFVCFGLFIVACGFTHVMEIITVWQPHYPAMAIVKAITAAASVPTAIILFRIAPKIVKLPSLQQLMDEQSLRLRAEAASEAKDRLIATLSHELRTPLTPVKAGIDVLEQELRQTAAYGAGSAAQQAVAMIRQNVEKERVLIEDLLDLSVSGRGKVHVEFTATDLRGVVEAALARLAPEFRGKNIQLTEQLDGAKSIVHGAPARLEQIITNLLNNAIKFTPEGGAIAVRLTNDADTVHVAVTDTGCGLDPASMERIFEPFEQFNRRPEKAYGGLGVGLTIAKALAESHGGELRAESGGVGRGATFTLSLPLAADHSAPSPPPEATPIPEADKPNVLLVDDHEDTLRTIALLLRRAGYLVQTAKSVSEAEPLLSRAELLISDIGLPDGDGWDLMARFRAQGGQAGIAISGFGQDEDFQRSYRAGFAEHLVKPIDIETLRRAMQSLRPTRS